MELSRNILFHIQNSSEIEFAWSKVPDMIRHTAVVLYFDGRPQLTIDFADSAAKKSASLMNYFSGISQLTSSRTSASIASAVGLATYNHDIPLNFVGTLLKIVISDEQTKERAKQLLRRLLGINMGEYHAKTKNCRHYIRRVFQILAEEPECDEISKTDFEEKMTEIEQEDKEKVDDALTKAMKGIDIFAVGVAGIIGGLLLSGGTQESDSDSD